ncbi:MAG: terminase family protein [Planctomycetota bacterium]
MSAAEKLGPRPTLWREEPPELQEGRVTRAGMWPHQREWWGLPNFIRGLVTGYGGGKTLALGKRMIELALRNAPCPVVTVSPTYPMALTTIVKTIDELLDGKIKNERAAGRRASYHLFRSQPYRFTIKIAGRVGTILCMSGDDPNRLKGANIAAAGIDEPFIQDRAVFDQIIARVRHPDATLREIDITGTPEGVVGWGYDLFEGELRKKYDVGLVQCSSTENKALPPDYLARLGQFDESAVAAYRDGKFVNLSSGRVYHSFDPSLHVQDIATPADAEIACGMDFNADPMAFVLFWRKGDRIHFLEEFEVRNSDAEQCAIKLRSERPQVRNVYPDASGHNRQNAGDGGKSAHAYLREHGLNVLARSTNPLLPDRRLAVNAGFRHGRVTLSRECRKLRAYLLAYTHEGSNKTSQKAMSHLLDAFSYPIAYLFPVDRQAARLINWRQA